MFHRNSLFFMFWEKKPKSQRVIESQNGKKSAIILRFFGEFRPIDVRAASVPKVELCACVHTFSLECWKTKTITTPAKYKIKTIKTNA